jgi:hypothetical protein
MNPMDIVSQIKNSPGDISASDLSLHLNIPVDKIIHAIAHLSKVGLNEGL